MALRRPHFEHVHPGLESARHDVPWAMSPLAQMRLICHLVTQIVASLVAWLPAENGHVIPLAI